ncbi:MAG: hypothetical protein ACRCYP_03550 [Alphaproteobacteria bacterium]
MGIKLTPEEKIKAIFPSLKWEVHGQEGKIQRFTSRISVPPAASDRHGFPIIVDVVLCDEISMASVTIGDLSRLQLFATLSSGLSIDQALAQLKQWFQQMAEVFAGVVG